VGPGGRRIELNFRGIFDFLQDRLGEDEFAEAWNSGQAMRLDDALAFVLEQAKSE
jgi:hypothetical protein